MSTKAVVKPGWFEGDWIQTFTGRKFMPLSPRVEDVCILDIAHALSNMCRFTGHVKYFYSVAQHSVLVSELITDRAEARWGLLHDASEAYLTDLPRPLKRSLIFGELYKKFENDLQAIICKAFCMAEDEPESVKHADTVLLFTEKRDLMSREPEPWKDALPPMERHIEPWTPHYAELRFLERFWELTR